MHYSLPNSQFVKNETVSVQFSSVCLHRSVRSLISRLHNQENIEQSSSKHPANAFKIRCTTCALIALCSLDDCLIVWTRYNARKVVQIPITQIRFRIPIQGFLHWVCRFRLVQGHREPQRGLHGRTFSRGLSVEKVLIFLLKMAHSCVLNIFQRRRPSPTSRGPG